LLWKIQSHGRYKKGRGCSDLPFPTSIIEN
jgi:hypothetical protein